MKKKDILNLAIIFFLLYTGFSTVHSGLAEDDDGIEADLEIIDAYFCDADNDQLEDDVITHFELDFELEDDYNEEFEFTLSLSLELPSGKTHTYEYHFVDSRTEYLGTMYFFSSATESGWYKVTIICTYYLSYNYPDQEMDSLIFDPPGSSDGTGPIGYLSM